MKNRQKILPWMYSLPALVLVGIIVIFPILYTGYISLTNMNMYHWDDYHLIGLSNFKRALLKVDSGFLNALLTTILDGGKYGHTGGRILFYRARTECERTETGESV